MHPSEYREACKEYRKPFDKCQASTLQRLASLKSKQEKNVEKDLESDVEAKFHISKQIVNADKPEMNVGREVGDDQVKERYARDIFELQTDVKGAFVLDGPLRLSILKPLHWEVVQPQEKIEIWVAVRGLNSPVPQDYLVELYLSNVGPVHYALNLVCPPHNIHSGFCPLKFAISLQGVRFGAFVLAGRIVSPSNYRLSIGPVTETSFYVKDTAAPASPTTDSSYWKVS